MDPLQALRDAGHYLGNGELAEAHATLQRYWQWRKAGGAEPAGGDLLASQLQQCLASRQRQRPQDRGPLPLADCLDELDWQHWQQPDDPNGAEAET